ncbi:MAG: serine/threonine protein kinase [Archangiaceae bacterium]|nr:serine/threonine protein kinase [Archangiaceae bacterium]
MSAQPYLRPTSALDRRTMGKYDVLCRLSTGGMSEIFLAYQKGLAGFRKIVVLKSILPDIRGEEEFVRMFLDEAKTTALFNHPHIAQVFDLDVDGETLFLAMEFVQGCTLVEMARACRQAKEPIPIGFTLLSVRDTALALHYAHTFTDPRGRKQVVIHRDVAEKNIMVTYEGTTKLLDFGIAKALGKGNGRTSVGMVKGTSGYMSPEQIRGEPLDARSDVFSLGVVLHECLTGMRLFHGKTPEEGMLSALREEIPPPSRLNPEVTPQLDAVVMKSLMRDRESRYGTSLEFARAVEKASSGQMWHPEQSGELVLRHFQDRVNQTRELIESTQAASGEHTGETRVGKLIADMQGARESNADKARTDPGDKPAPPLPPPVPRPSGVVINPPRAKNVGPNSPTRQAVVPGNEVTGSAETRETTDPATSLPPPAPPIRATRSSPLVPAVAPQPAMTVQLSGNPRDSYDDDNGAKTVPAALLPNGLYVSPGESRKSLPPPVPSAPPPPPVSALQRGNEETTSSGTGQGPLNGSGWATYDEAEEDDEDDEPGLKTTIARPFDEDSAAKSSRNKLPLYVGGGVVFGLLALGLVMFALDLGPFSPSGPPKPRPLVEKNEEPAKKEKEKEKEKEPPEPPREATREREEPPRPPAPAPEPEKQGVASPPPADSDKRKGATPPRPKTTRGKKGSSKSEEGDEPVADVAPAPAPKPEKEKKEKPAAASPSTGGATLTLVMGQGLLVTLNGAEVGTTPIFNKAVPVGRQVFKIHSPEGEVRTLALDIKPGSNSARQDFDSLGR